MSNQLQMIGTVRHASVEGYTREVRVLAFLGENQWQVRCGRENKVIETDDFYHTEGGRLRSRGTDEFNAEYPGHPVEIEEVPQPKKSIGKLTNEMRRCLALIEKYGPLTRYPGGFWGWEGAEIKIEKNKGEEYKVPIGYVGTVTIQALLKRDLITTTEFKTSRSGTFPVKVELKVIPSTT